MMAPPQTKIDALFAVIAADLEPIYTRHGWVWWNATPVTQERIVGMLHYLYEQALSDGGGRVSSGRLYVNVDEFGIIDAGVTYSLYHDGSDR